MKRNLFLTTILASLFLNFGYCQDSILVKNNYKGKYQSKKFEEYFINSIDSLKDGTYKRFSTQGKIIQIGEFENGKPTGIWKFYENNIWNRKYLSFDFDTQTEIFYKDFNQKKVYCSIKTNKGYELKAVDSTARFPGGEMALRFYIIQNLKIDFSKYRGRVEANIEIKKDGKVEVLKIRGRPNDVEIQNELIIVIQNMPNWIPAIENGNLVASKYIFPIRF